MDAASPQETKKAIRNFRMEKDVSEEGKVTFSSLVSVSVIYSIGSISAFGLCHQISMARIEPITAHIN